MNQSKLYTAIGNYRTNTVRNGSAYPVVMVNQQEYLLDPQEMAVWTILNWRLLRSSEIERHYNDLTRGLPLTERRTLEDCLARLVTRGLVACGTGGTDCDALYDLLGALYVVPMSSSHVLRCKTFLMLLLDGVPIGRASQIFRKPKLNAAEQRVLALTKQHLLSTAELIKCVELDATDLSTDERVMDVLYADAYTTSENIPDLMRGAGCRNTVLEAVSNLYLGGLVIFQRV